MKNIKVTEIIIRIREKYLDYNTSPKSLDLIKEYLEHNEIGLAYEELCCELIDKDTIVITQDLEMLKYANDTMNMDGTLLNEIGKKLLRNS